MRTEKFAFYADSLGENTEVTVLLPDGASSALYLLHGAGCCGQDFLTQTNISELSKKHRMAVVLPSCENSCYRNLPNGKRYFDFITEELPARIRKRFPIPNTRKNTFIGGISMGGYGAVRCALLMQSQYAKAFALSGSLKWKMGLRYMKVCGMDVSHLQGLPVEELSDYLEAQSYPLELMLQCGLGDPFLDCNKVFGQRAGELGYKITERYTPGDHDWDCWKRELPDCLNWLTEDNA